MERFFETGQDRLVKGLRKAGVRSLEAANQYLEQYYLPLWNERFTVTPAGDADAHRPLGKQHRLASSLSHVETRVIGHDYTLRYGRHLYQVAREHIQPRLRGQSVRVEQHLDGRLLVSAAEGELTVRLCEQPEPVATPPIVRPKPAPAPPTGGRRRWMYGFRLDPPLRRHPLPAPTSRRKNVMPLNRKPGQKRPASSR